MIAKRLGARLTPEVPKLDGLIGRAVHEATVIVTVIDATQSCTRTLGRNSAATQRCAETTQRRGKPTQPLSKTTQLARLRHTHRYTHSTPRHYKERYNITVSSLS